LFDATDIRANTVVARLRLVEAVVQLAMLIALLLDFAIGIALLGNYPFQRYFEPTHLLFTLQRLTIQRLPTQRLQLRLELALISLERLVLLRRLGLAMQAGCLPLQLLAQVGQACQILVGTTDTIFSLPTALLVFGDTGR